MNINRKGYSLEIFTLYYEELEKKKVANKSKVLTKKQKPVNKNPKVSFKERASVRFVVFRGRLNNVFKRIVPHRKNTKKATKMDKKLARQQQMRGILGIGLLFVVVSIAYSSYVIYNGVSSTASRVMLVPQVVFAILTLFKAFSKIYK